MANGHWKNGLLGGLGKSSMTVRERIQTYVRGFDDKLYGGIPKNSVVLVVGEPGTMKSSLCSYILYQNARQAKKRGVYFTFEQGRESLTNHLYDMGIDFSEYEEYLSIVDLSLIRKNTEKLGQHTWIDIFKMYARNLQQNMAYDIMVLDSLPVLEMLARFQDPRNDLFHLFEWLKELGLTTFVISEMQQSTSPFGMNGEDFLADGLIHVKMERVDDVNIQRRIRCVKMRGTNHSPHFHTLLFSEGEFQATRVISDKDF